MTSIKFFREDRLDIYCVIGKDGVSFSQKYGFAFCTENEK